MPSVRLLNLMFLGAVSGSLGAWQYKKKKLRSDTGPAAASLLTSADDYPERVVDSEFLFIACHS